MALPALALASGTAMSPVVSAKLVGKAEVPKGSPTGSGIVVLHMNAGKRTVCWTFEKVKGIDKPLVSHIHKGGSGAAGPVVVPLGGAFKMKGCTTTTASVAKAIVAKPGGYYVNIHTTKFPGGAIRGQLGKSAKKDTSSGGGGYGAGY
jgi:hypothetical protein